MPEWIHVDSQISRVEVYRSQALVTRTATAELTGKTGTVGLRLSPLPFLLRDDSVRLRLGGREGIRVTDVHLELQIGRREGNLRTEAEDKLHELALERLGVAVERERLLERIQYVRSLTPAEHEEIELPEPLAFADRHQVTAWMDLSDYVQGELATLWPRARDLDRALREIDDRVAEAHERLAAESSADAAALAVCRKAARLQLEVTRARDSQDLEFSYLVPAARWVPEYELRVDQEQDQAELVLRALAAQRSGEEWSQVELAFSTADLNRSAELPELDSWRIGKAQPPKPSGWKDLPDTIGELFEGYDRELGSLPAVELPAAPQLPQPKRLGAATESRRDLRTKTGRAVKDKLKKRAKGKKAPPPPPQAAPAPEPVMDLSEPEELYAEECEANMVCEDDMDMLRSEAPPAPSSAPMEMRAAPRRKSSILGAISGAVSRGLAKKEKADAPMMAHQSFGAGGMPGGAAVEFIEARLQASAEALSFRNLRMQGPGAPRQRGQLLASDLAERVAEQIGKAGAEVADAMAEVSARDLIAQAGSGVAEIYQLSLPVHAVSLEQSAGHFAVRYPMESPGTVLSDGQHHALTLLRRDGRVQRVFRCVPKVDTNVYQVAEFDNPLKLPLLAGAVRVFAGGDFIVTAPMNTTPPGKTIRVNLGVEASISVARNTSFNETTSGLLGGDTDLKHRITIDVQNKLAKPVRVEVFERIPVSHDDDIEVKLLSSAPVAESYDQTERGRKIRGGWRFRLKLDPGEKQTCRLEYQITIPSKQVLVGGNRRD